MGETPGSAHRAGVVALLGPPNAGKSTLLNRILGEKLAIVTRKPQTTRSRILGICAREGAQIVLVDTPGLHEGERPLNVALNQAVEEAARDCDLALLLVDLTRGWRPAHAELLDSLRARHAEVLVVGTKADLAERRRRSHGSRASGAGRERGDWPPAAAEGAGDFVRVSARTGEGIEELLQAVVGRLPESPPLYPEDALTDRPLRWLAGELVREAAFEALGQELPYSIAVEVVSFDESRPGLVRIDANLLVERNSQKRIVVGESGSMVRRIGTRARRQIEQLVGCQVHLALHVKIDPRWLKNARRIASLGYS